MSRMSRSGAFALIALLIVSACSSGPGDASLPLADSATSANAVSGIKPDSMGGMNHDMPAMGVDSVAGSPRAPAMPGMDHSRMPAAATQRPGTMTGMDHARMAAPAASAASPDAHAAHTASSPTPTTLPAHAQHETAPASGRAMPASTTPAGDAASDTIAMAKINALVERLLNDSVAREVVRRDSVLARLWQNEALKRRLTGQTP